MEVSDQRAVPGRVDVEVPDRSDVVAVAGPAVAEVQQAQPRADLERRGQIEPGAVVRLGRARLLSIEVAPGRRRERGEGDRAAPLAFARGAPARDRRRGRTVRVRPAAAVRHPLGEIARLEGGAPEAAAVGAAAAGDAAVAEAAEIDLPAAGGEAERDAAEQPPRNPELSRPGHDPPGVQDRGVVTIPPGAMTPGEKS